MTGYEEIYDEFKNKITDYDLPLFDATDQSEFLLLLLKSAIRKFSKCCVSDLQDRNDESETFNITLTEEEKDILEEWMVSEWCLKYVNNSENLRNRLNTQDFSSISPANLLNAISDVYEKSRKHSLSLMNAYSFSIHGDELKKWKP